MLLLGLIIAILIIILIVSNYAFILTANQMNELVGGTILLIFAAMIRDHLLNLDGDAFLPAFIFMLWYFATKTTANLINIDRDADIIRESYRTIELATSTVLFMLLIMFIRPILLDEPINSDDVVYTTILYLVWYALTKNIKIFS
jgi:hypothetical protein